MKYTIRNADGDYATGLMNEDILWNRRFAKALRFASRKSAEEFAQFIPVDTEYTIAEDCT